MFSAFSAWKIHHHIFIILSAQWPLIWTKPQLYCCSVWICSIVWTKFAFLSWGGIVFLCHNNRIFNSHSSCLHMASFVRFLQCSHYFLSSSVLPRQKCLSLSYERLTNPWEVLKELNLSVSVCGVTLVVMLYTLLYEHLKDILTTGS